MTRAPPEGQIGEFEWIARLRPLTRGHPAALHLMDDAAFLAGREGHELVISTDAMVEGVHFTADAPPGQVARRLIRANLSDLAAKAAEPIGYLLTTAFPPTYGEARREAFRVGLAADGEAFDLPLLGGDTTATAGPLVISATVLGWTPAGRRLERAGATPGDRLVVCGTIGDGYLAWKAARGELPDLGGALAARMPEPLLGLRAPLRALARAAADVSDGLVADAQHIAEASGCALALDLGALPLSAAGQAWLVAQADEASGCVALATGGDDYAVVCAVAQGQAEAFVDAVIRLGTPAVALGRFETGAGVRVAFRGQPVQVAAAGWRH